MIGKRAWMALLCLLLCAGVRAQTEQDFSIASVEVEGNRIATRSLILSVSSLEIGSALTPTSISESIRRLYRLGIFSDVKIEAETTDEGLAIFIIVEELPKLDGLEFSGNKKIKSKDLKSDLGLGVGGYISPFLIHQKAEEIKRMYAKKGYFRTTVESILEYNSDSTASVLRYRIDEKSKVKVEKVVLVGNVRVKSNDLIKKMRNRPRGFLKSSNFDQEKYSEDLEKIIEEYHKKGYIDAYLISDSTHIDTTRNKMTVYLECYEGPLYYFGEASFEGNEKVSSRMLAKLLKYKEGEVFSVKKYDESFQELHAAFSNIGHLYARIVDQRTTRSDSIVDIKYIVSEGLPAHIRLVNIVGNTKTKENVIRREISSFPGQVYNQAVLIRSVRDIMALNYFQNVEPLPIGLPDGDIDLEYRVIEKPTGQVSAGAGYNARDKVVGNLGMAIPNFRGAGQSLSFNTDFGGRRNSMSVSFTEPWMFGRPTLLGVDAFSLNQQWFSDYTEGRQGGSIRLGRRLRWPDNYFRVYASYRPERNRFYDFNDFFVESQSSHLTSNTYTVSIDTLTGLPDTVATSSIRRGPPHPGSILIYDEQWQTSSKLSLTISRDSRNLPEFATSGSKISYTLSNTGGILGGFWKYRKHSISIAKFFPLFWRFSVAARVDYSAINSPSGDNRVLISDRFTPGGTAYDGIVRGYDEGTLTPDSIASFSDTTFWYTNDTVGPLKPNTVTLDSTTFGGGLTRVRGKYMLTTNIELQIPVVERQAYLLLFFDAGNSWLHRRNIKPLTDLKRGYGFGFRIAVPMMGTLGFDFAKPLDKVGNQSQGWHTHFQIGTTFR